MANVPQMLRARQKGRTQKELAKELGVSPPFLCAVLKGRKPPGRKIMQALGLKRIVRYQERVCRSAAN